MICPKCHHTAFLKNTARPLATTAGIGAGGYVASSGCAAAGASVGAIFGPVGALAGGLLGVLIGAAAGGTTGHAVGKYIDEGIVRLYRCDCCGHEWRAA